MENIPAGNSSIQQCYVFRTTPGVLYTVESSDDLVHWTAQDEIYGLGHEYVVTMHEYTPAPPLPPETPPPDAPPPSINVSLRMQPASGEDGGTVVSWVSLDHGGPVIVTITGEMASAWNLIPLYVSHPGTYTYFVWHPGDALTPPVSNPPLGTKDSAMLAALEADLPAMNTEVETSAALARNAPAPAPHDPDSKRFWRIHVNAEIDTDKDGSLDWAEFEIAARGTGVLVAGVTADAFNADTNGDGIPDGEQLDADLDGTADAKDPDASDNTATIPIGPLPRYALFPITNAQPDSEFPDPLQISDKGTVLYADGTWTSGVWTSLLSPLDANGSRAGFAKAINDSNTILGYAYTEDLILEDSWGYACYWPDPAGQLTLVDAGDLRAEFTGYGTFNDEFEHEQWPGPLLANDGGFYFSTTRLSESTGFYEPFRYSRWKLPSGGAASETEAEPGLHYSNGPELQWGHDEIHEMVQGHNDEHLNGVVRATAALPVLPFMPTHVLSQPNGSVVAMSGGGLVKVFINGAWKESAAYANAIEISSDGTAIGNSHAGLTAPVLLNGSWTGIERTVPDSPADWKDPTVALLDTTPGGWILAQGGTSSPRDSAVMLPIKLSGISDEPGLALRATSVDEFSIQSTTKDPAAQNKPWIMVPLLEGQSKFILKAPLNTATPLKLKLTAEDVRFDGATEKILTEAENEVLIECWSANQTTRDVALDLSMGPVDSMSKPIGLKIMRDRIVRVKPFLITKRTVKPDPANPGQNLIELNHPDVYPTSSELTEYLNAVFEPQLNTTFIVAEPTELQLEWDADGNGSLDPSGTDLIGSELQPILDLSAGYVGNAKITIFFLGADKLIGGGQGRGFTNRPVNACWIVADSLASPTAPGSGNTSYDVAQTTAQ